MHSATGQSGRKTHTRAMSLGCLLAVALAAGGGRALAQPISSSALWLRADAITGVADGGAVSAWNDANDNGRSYEQGDSNKQPLLVTTGENTINNKPVLRFDGTNDFLQGNTASLSALQNQPGASAFAVRKLDATGVSVNILTMSVGGGTAGRFFITQGGDAHGRNNYSTGGRPTDGSTPVVFADNSTPKTNTSPAIQTGVTRFTGSQFSATSFANGVQAVTASTSSTASAFPNTASQAATIGSSIGGTGNLFKGNIAEIILYPRALDTAERSVVENYLGAKYALILSGNATADGNYNALSGTFRTDVIGIGRALDNSLATASGLGGLKLDGTLSTANTWLYSGNDGTANALVTSGNLPAGSAGYWARLWNVAKVGSVAGTDNLSLTFDWAAAGLTSQFDALTDKTTAGFALWSGEGTDVSGFSSLLAQATSVNTLDRTVTFSLAASTLPSGDNLTLVVVPEPQGIGLAAAGLAAAAWAARRRVAA